MALPSGAAARTVPDVMLAPVPAAEDGIESSPRDLFALPLRLVGQGGPSSTDHEALRDWLRRIHALVAAGRIARRQVTDFWRALGPDYLAGSTQGFALAKPHGYAGDFEVMDKIYRREVSADPRFRNWDLFLHAQSAASAVRNRQPYLASVLDEALRRRDRPRLHVLDLACGPAHHLARWLVHKPAAAVEVLCLDQDGHALEKAAEVCGDAGRRVRFERANVLRFVPQTTYDLVWSSGLFDYLSDRAFVRLVARLRSALRPGGEIVLSNFAPHAATRAYMELVADWDVRYRSEEDLLRLGAIAGAAPGEARVGWEPTGVNLFLHLRPREGL
jgi:extracellular factor (EF) 3-hydroxypalmitic acid methyl ester biosynthesis protein